MSSYPSSPPLWHLALFVVLIISLARVLRHFAEKVKLPTVIAELSLGILLGNLAVFESFWHVEILKNLAQVGALLLLFQIGLESDPRKILSVGKDAALAALYGVVAPCVLAFLSLPFVSSGQTFAHKLFLAAALSATSVAITARVLRDRRKLTSISGQIILGAAVIDDVLGIFIMALLTALVSKGSIGFGEILGLTTKILIFVVGILGMNRILRSRRLRRPNFLSGPAPARAILVAGCFLSAGFAELCGLAGIIGAFALGLIVDNHPAASAPLAKGVGAPSTREELLKPLTNIFVPLFFVVMGMQVPLTTLAAKDSILMTAVLIVCALVGKLFCSLAVSAKSKRLGADPLFVGIGMIPRGEVGIIFAAMGLQLGILRPEDYGAIVLMVFVTTLVAPLLMAWRSQKI